MLDFPKSAMIASKTKGIIRMKCRGPNCSVIIKWITNEQGKRVPCDPEPIQIVPEDRGPIIGYTENGAKIRGRLTSEVSVPHFVVYQAHHQTCPDVNLFRLKK